METDGIKEIVAIGDVHGKDIWKDVVRQNPEAHLVFLGDYCDPYKGFAHITLRNNLKEIIELKRSSPERVTLLLGNHDLHYFNSKIPRGSRYDAGFADELRNLFNSEINLFCYAWQYRNILFTHAGVSQYWIDNSLCHNILPDAAACLNDPSMLSSNPDAVYDCGFVRNGNSDNGGIFWADLKELDRLPVRLVQVAGHNRVKEITRIHSCTAGDDETADLFACDCLYLNKYLKIIFDGDKAQFYEMSTDGSEPRLLL